MHEHITRAIQERWLLRFIYETKQRMVVEPYAFGLSWAKREELLCWQVLPPLSDGVSWRLLRLDRISALQILDQHFDAAPQNRPPVPVDCALLGPVQASPPDRLARLCRTSAREKRLLGPWPIRNMP